jgi:hypothetical protein
MPKVPRSVLKSFFETGDRPTQSDFASLIDSMLHYSEDRNRFGLRSYDPAYSYTIGDTTIYAGSIYQCVMQTTGPFDAMRWQQMVALGSVVYIGAWNAATNTPTIQSGVGSKGHYYVVSANGSTAVDGVSSWMVGDWIIYNGSTWEKVDNTDDVAAIDVTFSPTGEITSLNVQAAIVELAQDTSAALDGKVDKLPSTAGGNLVQADGDGNLNDTGFAVTDFLSKENTDPYTPSEIHNPATKKYVDDGDAGKADIVSAPIAGNLAALNASGNLTDSGLAATNILAKDNIESFLPTDDFNPATKKYVDDADDGKMDKVIAAINGNLAALSTSGNLTDSGLAATNILAKDNIESFLPTDDFNPATKKYVDDVVVGKTDKIIPTSSGNFAGLDANGNLIDSGLAASNFLGSTTSANQIPFTPNGNITATNVQNAIVELRDDTAAKLNEKVDKLSPTAAGKLVQADSDGNLTDSGLSADNILAKDNIESYAPLTDFNPATKKYVDDADAGKTDKVSAAIAGNIAALNASGNLTDSGLATNNILAKDNTQSFSPTGDFNPATKKYVDDGDTGKADKVSAPIAGNLAALNASGNLTDSGFSANDFLTNSTNALQIPFSPTPDVTSTNVQSAIDEVAQDLVAGLAGKANKVSGATLGNFAALNSSGNLTDSNFSPEDYLHKTNTEAFDPTGDFHPATKKYVDDTAATKATKVIPSAIGNIALLLGNGNLADSGVTQAAFLRSNAAASDIAFIPNGDITAINVQNAIVEVRDDTDTKLNNKVNIVSPAIAGNFAALTATGQATDSGLNASSFLSASAGASVIAFNPNGDIASTTVQNAIVEVRDETDTKLGGKMGLVTGAAIGNIATFNATGQAIDSGLSPSDFLTSTPPATGVAFTPNGDIAATNVQNAIVEVRDETDTKLVGKMGIVAGATTGNLATFNAAGQAIDSGFSPSSFLTSTPPASGVAFTPNGDIAATNVQSAIVEVRDETDTKLGGKMGLVAGAASGNIATLNAAGQVIDSGLDPSDFLTSSPPASGVAFTPNGDITATNAQNAIVEVRNDTDEKLLFKMQLVEAAVNGNIAILNGTGQALDSGLRPANFMSAGANATNIPFTPNGDIAALNVQNAVVELRDDTDIKLALLRRQTMAFTFAANIVFPSATVTLTFVRMASQMLIPAANLSHPGTTTVTAVLVIVYSTAAGVVGEAGLMDFTTSSTVAAINGSTVALPTTASTTTFNTAVSGEFTLPAATKVYSPLYRKTVAVTGTITVQSVALILKYT